MTEEMVKKVRDPFVTTRLTRKVGMGIPFMDMVTSQCGGYFNIKSQPGEGTVVKAAFRQITLTVRLWAILRAALPFCWQARLNLTLF